VRKRLDPRTRGLELTNDESPPWFRRLSRALRTDDVEISRHTPPARALVRLAAVMPRLLALALATLLAAPARAFYLPGVAPQDFALVRALALLALSSRAFAPLAARSLLRGAAHPVSSHAPAPSRRRTTS
jgi:hypothetical protein